jgi:uncharacterized peroxidase-related enzyme
LRRLLRDDTLVDQILRDYRTAELGTPDRTMLDYAVMITREPWAVDRADLDRLRSAGFSDRAILDMNLVTGYYAFVNRLADGLGVPLESPKSEETPGEKHD